MKAKELAKIAAKSFRKTMKEEGFKTFNEMKKCYWWDAEDIRDEIRYALESEGVYCMSDNGKEIECDEYVYGFMKYGEFKKLVMAELKCDDEEEED